jgi:hypothetical protein
MRICPKNAKKIIPKEDTERVPSGEIRDIKKSFEDSIEEKKFIESLS